MGNEAIALASITAGVNVVTGYPGTPSTEVLETVAKNNPGDIYVEWSVNEKSALEVGAGAAYTGARVMVTMKQVGLNVASDPAMCLNYVGVKGGLIILVADDPGPLSSQTEQDTRHFGKYANIPVFDPSTPEEAFNMVFDAFELSERIGQPVILRPTTRVCHARASIEVSDTRLARKPEGFIKDPRWVIFPPLAHKRHNEIEHHAVELEKSNSNSRFNEILNSCSDSKIGIAAGGVSFQSIKEIIEKHNLSIPLLRVGTPFPAPKLLMKEFLANLDEVVVFEELDPVIEEALIEVAYDNNLCVKILGKRTQTTPFAGEFSYDVILNVLKKTLPEEFACRLTADTIPTPPVLPTRPPVLCAGCPHRASFYAVKMALKGKKAVFTGDIGCYTLGNAMPLDMTDTCLCMRAGITVAQGISRCEPDSKQVAFIGDSTFFHSGIVGIVNAVYNKTNLTVAILDNYTTAMTGHQPHPGIGRTMMGIEHGKVDIYNLVKSLGVDSIERCNPFDQKKAIELTRSMTEKTGVNVILFESPCIAIVKKQKHFVVNDKCVGCQKCIKEIGCPAMYLTPDKKVAIEPSLCYGCGLCTTICPVDAIEAIAEGAL